MALFPYLVSFAGQDEISKVEKAFEIEINDSTSIQINLEYNNNGLPEQYTSHIETPVCKDGLCYLMVIDLTWDVLGNFLKYNVPENLPLTKFDHEEFTEDDHIKMKEILSNKDSFLRFYALENLIDTTEQRTSSAVDGVSGATHKSIQNEVVGGAVFSTYVLWHIVNGPVATKILTHTEDRFTDSLMIQLLESDNHHYQYYALQRMSENDNSQYLPYIVRLIAEGADYVPYFAIDKVPEKAWKSTQEQVQIIGLIEEIDFEMQNELLNRINGIALGEEVLDVLASSLGTLREGQLIKALDVLLLNKGRIGNESLSKITALNTHLNKEISGRAHKILEK